LHAEQVDGEERRLAITIGAAIREERRRRGMSIRDLASLAGLGASTVHAVECGRPSAIRTYAALALALGFRTEFTMQSRRQRPTPRDEDPVHAAMGEFEARHFQSLGFRTLLDEPFQHYQFSGRGDFGAIAIRPAHLLHIENKTRVVNVQDAIGSFNAKRAYLGREMADRIGVGSWESELHVLAMLWSAETIHAVRLHRATMTSVCPDEPGAFERWWRGEPQGTGRRSVLIFLDPAAETGRAWAGLDRLDGLRPRYRGYAEAARPLAGTGAIRAVGGARLGR